MINNEYGDWVKRAYKKLKSYAYYDNSSFVLRKQICEFEEDENFEKKLEKISQYTKKELETLLKDIQVKYFPKKIKKNIDEESISNKPDEEVVITETTVVAKIPLEIQIMGVIWVMKTTKFFEGKFSEYIYANRIRDNQKSLFKPYYQSYSKWRADGIKAIDERLEQKKDIVYIGLDLKNYYYSVDMNDEHGFDSLKKELENFYGNSEEYREIDALMKLIKKTCEKFSSECIRERRCILPVGFLPSNILGNWYLKAFDEMILENINPLHYGRYVDDIVIVCGTYNSNLTKEKIKDKFLYSTKVIKKVKSRSKDDKDLEQFKVGGYKNLFIQDSKLEIKVIDHRYSSIELEVIKDELIKNGSEFRILPENIEDCMSSIYKINFKENMTKLNGLKNDGINKLELSKSVSKTIFKIKQDMYTGDKRSKLNKELNNIFIYGKAIENFRMWEKIIFYLNQSNQKKEIEECINNLNKAIEKIEIEIDEKLTYKLKIRKEVLLEKIKKSLKENIEIGIAMMGAIKYSTLEKVKKIYTEEEFEKIEKLTKNIIKANMMRQNYGVVPLLNFCGIKEYEKFDLITFEIERLKKIELNEKKLEYSPRFIHLHEFMLYYCFRNLNKLENSNYIRDAKMEFLKSNYGNYKINDENQYFKLKSEEVELNTFGSIFEEETQKKYKFNKIEIKNDECEIEKEELSIGIANIDIDTKEIEKIIRGEKICENKSIKKIKKILNEGQKNNVDIIVLPEASIPIQWISFIAEFSRKHNIVIICGVQHFRLCGERKVANILATIIPIKKGEYFSTLVKFRVKNYYAPFEKEVIESHGLEIVNNERMEYDFFSWNGINFSCYNCFELASIEDRSLFKGHIDVMFASVLNKDTAYFSNIVDTVVRDLHCYFVQVNNSKYGDNRITRPTKKDYKDILKVKGGRNSYLVVEKINIKKLREFQILDHRKQLNHKEKIFKPTPPNFNVNIARNKIGLKKI